jgi:hypothetical protein
MSWVDKKNSNVSIKQEYAYILLQGFKFCLGFDMINIFI